MELNTKVNGTNKGKRTAEEFKFGLMAHSTKDIGLTIRLMEKDVLSTLMETCITANGKMIKHMATVFTTTLMALDTRASGLRTSSTELAKKFGPTALNMKVSIRKVKSTAMVSSTGQTVQPTQDNLSTTTFMVTVSTHGLMDADSTVLGKTTKCTAVECSLGTTVASTRENTSTTKNRDKVSLPGPMAASMTASGKMASSMALASTTLAKAK